MRKIFLIIICLSMVLVTQAQDTTGRITITSQYRPELRNAVKIDLNASPVKPSGTLKMQPYTIPSQSLNMQYQPVAMKPLLMNVDTSLLLGSKSYIKAGFGNYTTPFVEGGTRIGNGKDYLINLSANYISSKGKDVKYQDYSNMGIKVAGSHFKEGKELYGSMALRSDRYFLYGVDTNLHAAKSDLLQKFKELNLLAGFKNTAINSTGINYNPNIKVGFFNYGDYLNETNLKLALPFSSIVGEHLHASLLLAADLSKISPQQDLKFNAFSNNIFYIKPGINYTTDNVLVRLALAPTWQNSQFEMLPDIESEVKSTNKQFIITAGFKGNVQKNDFAYLSTINPFLVADDNYNQLNTITRSLYGGIKTIFAEKFTVQASVGWESYKNLSMMVNSYPANSVRQGFTTVYASKGKNLKISGDASYIIPNKISVNAGITLNGYNNLKDQEKPWHLPTLEARSSLRYFYNERMLLKADLYSFGGYAYKNQLGVAATAKGGTDLSLGGEYKINSKFSAWLQLNNLFNSKYQRWHGYPVYGANFLGGVLIRF